MMFQQTLILSTVTMLCQAHVIKFKNTAKIDGQSASLTEKGQPNMVELAERAWETTDAGAISAGPADGLYVRGLATCVGMAGVGTANEAIGTDKVLAHVRCENAGTHIDEWVDAMVAADMTQPFIAVSIVDPEQVDESLRDGQRALNRVALTRAASFVPGETWRVLAAYRTELEGAAPLGTMQIDPNKDMWADGVRMLWPVPQTQQIECNWPVYNTPTDAPQDTKDEMQRLANQICLDGSSCEGGATPYCANDNDQWKGYCGCIDFSAGPV